MLGELSGQFEQDVTRLHKTLTQAVLEQDQKSCAAAAHELKGSSGCAAAMELQNLARIIEQVTQRGEWRELDEIVAVLPSALARFQKALIDSRSAQNGNHGFDPHRAF